MPPMLQISDLEDLTNIVILGSTIRLIIPQYQKNLGPRNKTGVL